MQHVIYQVQYQQALKTQVQSILETLQTNEFETLSEYLTHSYEDGFIGTMYDLQGQGIPLIFPLDQMQIVDAIQHETKLSASLYTALGHDIKDLQKKIAGEISRGIAGGQMYTEIARNVSSWARIPKNNAMRIARTEAHRIQCKAAMDAQHKAKEKGADVVKQWDASLDKRTRDSHRDVDGEIRELDEPFSNGLKYPGDPSGRAEEVINCRCALLQRARWALGNDYTKWSADAEVVIDDDGTTQFAIIEAKNYKDFQKQYKQASERVREDVQMMNANPWERNRSGERIIRKGKNKCQNKYGDEIIFDISNAKNQERAEAGKKVLMKLSNEYDTYLTSVGVGAKKASGSVDSVDGRMLLNSWKPDTYIHEFAHSLTTTDRIKLGFADEREIEFMNELKKIRKSYRAELYGNPKKGISANPTISISAYADESIDEFFAEAFAQSKMVEMGIELPQSFGSNTKYSNQVLTLTDKYFKKATLVNNGKHSYNVPNGVNVSKWKVKTLDTTPEQDAVLANINYNKGELYKNNCQRCVPAYEMRRRGYDVTAKPRIDGVDDVADNWLNVFENIDIVSCDRGNGLAQIEATMKKYGNGARAEIYVEVDANNSHVFVAEQRDGKTVFIDPQDGNRDARSYFDYVVEGKTEMFRIDNLEPTDLIFECCEEYK